MNRHEGKNTRLRTLSWLLQQRPEGHNLHINHRRRLTPFAVVSTPFTSRPYSLPCARHPVLCSPDRPPLCDDDGDPLSANIKCQTTCGESIFNPSVVVDVVADEQQRLMTISPSSRHPLHSKTDRCPSVPLFCFDWLTNRPRCSPLSPCSPRTPSSPPQVSAAMRA